MPKSMPKAMPRKVYLCLGREPMPGCGVTLTAVEVRTYETTCEHCETAFQARWRNWCLGDDDAEFEELFGEVRKPKALRKTA